MAKKPDIHPHSDRNSFERLLLLIATFLRYPGIGSRKTMETPAQDALESVQQHLQQMAQTLAIPVLDYSVHTLRKDLGTLRRYGILSQNRHDWGYYLGTGVMSRAELQLCLNALASQAKYQGDPQARQVYHTVARRLRGLDVELNGEFLYPVRQQLNRSIVETDPDEMMAKGKGPLTLFHQLELLEQAIYQGHAVELSRSVDPYGKSRVGLLQVYPLQLIYYDIAWYLLCEYVSDGHLAIHRMNRFKNHCQVLTSCGRGVELQRKSLALAHRLLENGWGLFLGEPQEQQAELSGSLTLETVKVRFYPPVMQFILEGDRRHPKQQIRKGGKDPETGQYQYVDYSVSLPPRSLKEFSLWVYRHMGGAQVLSPPDLVEHHRQVAQALVNRYP